MSEWVKLTDGTFAGYKFHVVVPSRDDRRGVVSEEVVRRRRLQVTTRPGQSGAKIRDWGGDPRRFSAEIVFLGPKYRDDWEAFEKVLTTGAAGELKLPDQPKVQAFVEEIAERADHSGGNSKTVRVTWIEDGFTTDAAVAGAAESPEKTLFGAKSLLDSALDAATSVMRDNPLLSAVRTFEAGLSTVRRYANAVSTLTSGVRNRIKQIEANINGTIALVRDVANEITDIFGSSRRPSPAPTGFRRDPQTGNEVVDFRNLGEDAEPEDPLDPPDVEPEVAAEKRNIDTPAGVELLGKKLIDSLAADRDQLAADAGGRADDVVAALSGVIDALEDFIGVVTAREDILVQVPTEMTLLEVLFYNGLPPEDVQRVYRKNTFIEDINVIPAGTFVAL